MALLTLERDGDTMVLEQTQRGRLQAGAFSALNTALVSAAFMALLFGADVVRDYADLGDSFGRFFLAFVFGASALFGLIAGVMRARSGVRWTFDRRRGRIVRKVRTSLGRSVETESPLDDLIRVGVFPGTYWVAPTLAMELSGEGGVVLVRARLGFPELQAHFGVLRDFLDVPGHDASRDKPLES